MQRTALRWKRQGARIAFVPTMGCLHAGHLSLMKAARRLAGRRGKVVVSIFVNPLQFGRGEDFRRYPRTLARDKKLCAAAGADLLFVPSEAGMYSSKPGENFSTKVMEQKLSRPMEGASRPGHFEGVTTVVAKLFNLVQPDWAVFGAKDFQQAAVARRMARDLNFPVKVEVALTKRELDGLAMSSRNGYLSADERRQAAVLWEAIRAAQKAVAERGEIAAAALKQQLAALIETAPAARVDYIEIFDPRTLDPAPAARRGAHLALAAFVGKTRLIDNAAL